MSARCTYHLVANHQQSFRACSIVVSRKMRKMVVFEVYNNLRCNTQLRPTTIHKLKTDNDHRPLFCEPKSTFCKLTHAINTFKLDSASATAPAAQPIAVLQKWKNECSSFPLLSCMRPKLHHACGRHKLANSIIYGKIMQGSFTY